ncbi:Transducin (beta)-like 3 [Balamuthia mandrillaris]
MNNRKQLAVVHVLEGHSPPAIISDTQFSLSGSFLITACHDHIVRVWDPKSYSLLHNLGGSEVGHAAPVNRVALHPEREAVIASCADNGTLLLWNMETGDCLCELHSQAGYSSRPIGLHDITFATPPYTNVLLAIARSYYRKAEIQVWNVEAQMQIQSIRETTQDFCCVVADQTGSTFLVGSEEGLIRQYDMRDGGHTRSAVINTGQQDINTISFDPCGRFFLSSDTADTILVYDIRKLEEPLHLFAHGGTHKESGVQSCQWTKTGFIVSGGEDACLRFWDCHRGGRDAQIAAIKTTHPISSVALTPNEDMVASGNEDGSVYLFSLPDETYLLQE